MKVCVTLETLSQNTDFGFDVDQLLNVIIDHSPEEPASGYIES